MGSLPVAKTGETTIKYLPLIFLFALGLSGCQGGEPDHGDAIRFGSAVHATRAPVDSDMNGVAIQDMDAIWVLRGTDGTLTGQTFAQTLPASTASMKGGTGKMVLETPQYLNAAQEDAHFIALYPAPQTYASNRAAYRITGAEDLLAAGPKTASRGANGPTPIPFSFDHLLGQIDLKVVVEEIDGDGGEGVAQRFGMLLTAWMEVPDRLEVNVAADGAATLTKTPPAQGAPESLTELYFVGNDQIVQLTAAGFTSNKRFMIYPIVWDEDDDDPADTPYLWLEFEHCPARAYRIPVIAMQPGQRTLIVATLTAGNEITFRASLGAWSDLSGEELVPLR